MLVALMLGLFYFYAPIHSSQSGANGGTNPAVAPLQNDVSVSEHALQAGQNAAKMLQQRNNQTSEEINQ